MLLDKQICLIPYPSTSDFDLVSHIMKEIAHYLSTVPTQALKMHSLHAFCSQNVSIWTINYILIVHGKLWSACLSFRRIPLYSSKLLRSISPYCAATTVMPKTLTWCHSAAHKTLLKLLSLTTFPDKTMDEIILNKWNNI